VGGWPGHFFYGHEGIDLAWRLCDAQWVLRYAPEIIVHHPSTSPTRHRVYYRMNARNRVWLARRNLPAPLALIHLLIWVALTVIRVRNLKNLKIWFTGFWEGLTTDCGPRRPMKWRTAWRMLRNGRPPII
jgi:GT2 family glycosyltransferase